MAEDKMKQLMIMADLCGSVVEGIEHLLTSPGNEDLLEEAVTGFITLERSFVGLDGDISLAYETRWLAEVVRSRLFVYDGEFKDRLYRWYYSALKEIRDLMTSETEKCPVCGGKGSPCYGAVFYTENGARGSGVLKPVRVFIKCRDCGSYYLAQEEVLPGEEKKRLRRTKVGCSRILSSIDEFMVPGTMLFIGEKKSQLYKEAEKAGYALRVLSLEEVLMGTDREKETYPAVVIDRIPSDRRPEQILARTAEYLSAGGILWFDGPDMKKSIRNLGKKGAAMWKGEASAICLTADGMEALAKKCGLFLKSCRYVGTAFGRIEFIAEKSV